MAPAIALGQRPAAPEEVLSAVASAVNADQFARALAAVESAELHFGPWDGSALGMRYGYRNKCV